MPKEPSNWKRILSILAKSGLPENITSNLKIHEQEIQSYLVREKHLLGVKMPGERIIELWLNTVFAHGGIEGKNRRTDFESAVNQFGHGAFEWSFRSLVKWVGLEFMQISNAAAKPALIFYNDRFSLTPSFKISAAFGIKRKEKTHDGHLIIREGSTEHFSEETFEERFTRILSRDENRDVRFVFKYLDRTPTELLRATLGTHSFADLLSSFEGRLEIRPVDGSKIPSGSGFRASGGVGPLGFPVTQSRVNIFDDCVVVTNERGVQTLEASIVRFRQQLLEKEVSL